METSLKDIKEFKLDTFEDFRGEIFTTYKDSIDGKKFDRELRY